MAFSDYILNKKGTQKPSQPINSSGIIFIVSLVIAYIITLFPTGCSVEPNNDFCDVNPFSSFFSALGIFAALAVLFYAFKKLMKSERFSRKEKIFSLLALAFILFFAGSLFYAIFLQA